MPAPKPTKPQTVMDFDKSRDKKKVGHPFRLGGELFVTLPEVPAGSLYELGITEEGTSPYNQFVNFILSTIPDEDAERFMAVLRSKDEDKIVGIKIVSELSGWLMETLGKDDTEEA